MNPEALKLTESGQNGPRPRPHERDRPGRLTVSDKRRKDVEGVREAIKMVAVCG